MCIVLRGGGGVCCFSKHNALFEDCILQNLLIIGLRHFKLTHEISPTRYKTETLQNVPVGYLWCVEMYTAGIDYFHLISWELPSANTDIYYKEGSKRISKHLYMTANIFFFTYWRLRTDFGHLFVSHDNNTLKGTTYLTNVLNKPH